MLMGTNGHTILSEDYVSFEVAKLLKEKGFDEKVSTHYLIHPSGFPEFFDKKDEFTEPGDVWLKCPTLQMAMKWLREVHNIDIEVHADVGMLGVKVYTPFISRYKSSTEYPSKLRQYKNGLYFEDDRGVIPGIRHFETYKEAVEAALKYSLENLI